MIEVELKQHSFPRCVPIRVRLRHGSIPDYSQVQLEIFDTCVMNPASRLGKSATPQDAGDGWASIEFDSAMLSPGIFELKLLRLHSPTSEQSARQLDFFSMRDFPRILFEVVGDGDNARTIAEIQKAVSTAEERLLNEFLEPIDLAQDGDGELRDFGALVFVRGVLISISMRFRGFEIIPAGFGIERNDQLAAVNKFLDQHTRIDSAFDFDADVRAQISSSNPVCVVHFPHVVGKSEEAVRDYCVGKVSSILLALSLIRDAGGVVFDIVLVKNQTGSMTNYSVAEPYAGNALVGGLAGESADRLQSYLEGMACDSMGEFLAGLYKQARMERQADYQYVRYWQILEILADLKNFDPQDDLVNHDGIVMTVEGRPRKCNGSIHTVYASLRDEGIGSTEQTWEQVNVWFAFRSAVAHHGAVVRWPELSREQVRNWARKGAAQIQESGLDRFLWSLKEDTKLLIMKKLVRAAQAENETGP